jgi:hypothetical protein
VGDPGHILLILTTRTGGLITWSGPAMEEGRGGGYNTGFFFSLLTPLHAEFFFYFRKNILFLNMRKRDFANAGYPAVLPSHNPAYSISVKAL